MKPFDETPAWALMLAVVAARRQRERPERLAEAIHSLKQWRDSQRSNTAAQAFMDLYAPLLFGESDTPLVVGHLGQSLEACIATASGDSVAMTGPSNHRHLHRMRALCDAIVVGGNTAAQDDPRLNTRLVPGTNPVRVIIDPDLRLGDSLVLMDDGEAPTLIVCKDTALKADPTGLAAALKGKTHCAVIAISSLDGELPLPELFKALHRRGLQHVFVEGGGITVSRCLQVGVLDRLHVATSATLVGEGHGALRLPPVPSMAEAFRPHYRLFRMGDDVLWDLDVRSSRSAAGVGDSGEELSAGQVEIERLI